MVGNDDATIVKYAMAEAVSPWSSVNWMTACELITSVGVPAK